MGSPRTTLIGSGLGVVVFSLLAGCGGGDVHTALHASNTTAIPHADVPSTSKPPLQSSVPYTLHDSTSSTAPTPPTTVSGPSKLPTMALPTVTLGRWTGTRPKTIYFTVDGGNIVSNIVWSTWNAQSAVGHGTWGYESCQPSCAQGGVVQYPATVTFSSSSNGQFTELQEAQSGPFGKVYTYHSPDLATGASS